MANPDYYDLRKLRTLVEPNMRKKESNNPNTAYYRSDKFKPANSGKPNKKRKK